MSRIIGLVVVGLCLCVAAGVLWAQTEPTPQQLRTQLELVKTGRDFSERLAAQAVSGLEEQLAQVKAELAACQKPKAAEETKP